MMNIICLWPFRGFEHVTVLSWPGMDSVVMEECVNGQVGLQLTNRERGLRPYGQCRDGGMCERSSGPSAYKQGKRPHALWTVS